MISHRTTFGHTTKFERSTRKKQHQTKNARDRMHAAKTITSEAERNTAEEKHRAKTSTNAKQDAME